MQTMERHSHLVGCVLLGERYSLSSISRIVPPTFEAAWRGASAAYDIRPAPYTAAHLRVRALADIVSGIAVE